MKLWVSVSGCPSLRVIYMVCVPIKLKSAVGKNNNFPGEGRVAIDVGTV